MIPGGVTSVPSQRDIIRALSILDTQIKWYENSILGCSIEEWLSLKSVEDFNHWLEKKRATQDTTATMWSNLLKTKTKKSSPQDTHPNSQCH
ncbi:hypothetical protein PN36_25525 [Candidatus Thiomargarita nelsonii]|uniref:Uncharacterized protein n=1 Tax=Candidatus Thiomargarita nelsonii TaxID=1003181 RepID=A0A4E0QMX9_9GAMM|nr:hypothetical protein PN36_25525 [Candidatus Thiomargarita nelsonii]